MDCCLHASIFFSISEALHKLYFLRLDNFNQQAFTFHIDLKILISILHGHVLHFEYFSQECFWKKKSTDTSTSSDSRSISSFAYFCPIVLEVLNCCNCCEYTFSSPIPWIFFGKIISFFLKMVGLYPNLSDYFYPSINPL